MVLLGGVEGLGDGDLFTGGAGDFDLDFDLDLLAPSDFGLAVVVFSVVLVEVFDVVDFGFGFVVDTFLDGCGFKNTMIRYNRISDPTIRTHAHN